MASSKDKGSSDGDRNTGTSKRGFASMDEEKQRAIASKGGKAAHEKGTAHEFDSEEAREAGRAAHKKGTAHKFDSEQAREAGRKGGKAAHERGTAHEFDSAEARIAGRKGGEASRSGKNGNRSSA
jgi:general stress protein YciG